MVFLILASYELARSPVESLFVEKHTAAAILGHQLWWPSAACSSLGCGAVGRLIDLVGVLDWLVDSVPGSLWIAIGLSGRFAGQLHLVSLERHLHCLAHRDFWSFANQVMPLSKASQVLVLVVEASVVLWRVVGWTVGSSSGHTVMDLDSLLGVVWLGCVLQSPEMTGTVPQAKNSTPAFVTGFGCYSSNVCCGVFCC